MLRKLALALLTLTCHLAVFAQQPSIQSAPSWLYAIAPDHNRKANEKEISDGFYYGLMDVQVNIPAQTEYSHFIRHIINETGVQQASEVSVTYSPEYQKVTFHYINQVRDGRIISRLSPKQIRVVQEETAAGNYQYNNEKRAFVILEDVRKDDRIDYAYSVTGFNPVFGNHFTTSQYFTYGTPITNFFYSVFSSPAQPLRYALYNQASQPVVKDHNNLKLYHWSQPELKKYESVSGAPAWFDKYPYTTLTTFKSWAEVGSWGVKVFSNYRFPLDAPLKKKIDELRTQSKGNKDLYAELATRYVQDEIRYLGFEVGVYTHKPHDPNNIFRQGYGDCKDKALLLVCMLREEGIQSYVALVHTGLRAKVENESPAAIMFNHAIVAIERSSGYVFIDATNQQQRGSLINIYIPPYGKSLVLKEGTGGLEDIEEAVVNNVEIEEDLSVKAADKGNSTLKVKTIYSGGIADDMRSYFSSSSKSAIEQQYTNYYSAIYDSIKLSGEIGFVDDSIENIVTVTETYEIPGIWEETDHGKRSFSVLAKAIYEKLPSAKNLAANAPLSLPDPGYLRYKMNIHMPEHWSFPLKPFKIENDSYRFSYKPEVAGNTITLTYLYKTIKDHLPAEEVAVYRKDYARIEDVLQFELYQTDGFAADDTANTSSAQSINWPSMLLTLFCAVIGLTFIRWYNNRQLMLEWTDLPEKRSGATGFLGFTLVGGGIIQLYNFLTSGYYTPGTYQVFEDAGGEIAVYAIYAELFVSLAWLIGVCALCYWYFMKRDIFPRFFIGYALSLLIGNLVLLTVYNVSKVDALVPDAMTNLYKAIGRSCLYCLVWIPYVIKSQNVKRVFVKSKSDPY